MTVDNEWYIIKVRVGRESVILNMMQENNKRLAIVEEIFLPIQYISKRKSRSNIIINVEQSIYPGYIFLKMNKHAKKSIGKLINSEYNYTFLPNSDNPVPVSDEYVLEIKDMVDNFYKEKNDYNITNDDKCFVRNEYLLDSLSIYDRVQVISGALEGFSGYIDSFSGKDMICIIVEIFGRKVPATININEIIKEK
ncbi:MAG: hypothetical protein OEY79_02650 [Anaplasmataceae bacterium]|nr:hypothetical protein [Anaplasmataceae bacterium]